MKASPQTRTHTPQVLALGGPFVAWAILRIVNKFLQRQNLPVEPVLSMEVIAARSAVGFVFECAVDVWKNYALHVKYKIPVSTLLLIDI